jgi:hypothetical protein
VEVFQTGGEDHVQPGAAAYDIADVGAGGGGQLLDRVLSDRLRGLVHLGRELSGGDSGDSGHHPVPAGEVAVRGCGGDTKLAGDLREGNSASPPVTSWSKAASITAARRSPRRPLNGDSTGSLVTGPLSICRQVIAASEPCRPRQADPTLLMRWCCDPGVGQRGTSSRWGKRRCPPSDTDASPTGPVQGYGGRSNARAWVVVHSKPKRYVEVTQRSLIGPPRQEPPGQRLSSGSVPL